MAGHADERDEVPLAGDRIGLGDAFDVGEVAAERRHGVPVGLDQDDGRDHQAQRAAGVKDDDARLARALDVGSKAWASVSIGGNVS